MRKRRRKKKKNYHLVTYGRVFFGSDLLDEQERLDKKHPDQGRSALVDLAAFYARRIEDCPTRAEVKPDYEYIVSVTIEELGLRGRA